MHQSHRTRRRRLRPQRHWLPRTRGDQRVAAADPAAAQLILDRVPADVFRDAAGGEGMQSCANRPLPRQWQASLHSRRSIVSPSWIDRLLARRRQEEGRSLHRPPVGGPKQASAGRRPVAHRAMPRLHCRCRSSSARLRKKRLPPWSMPCGRWPGPHANVCRCMSRSPIGVRDHAIATSPQALPGERALTAQVRWRLARTSGSLRQPATARFSAGVRMAPAQCC